MHTSGLHKLNIGMSDRNRYSLGTHKMNDTADVIPDLN